MMALQVSEFAVDQSSFRKQLAALRDHRTTAPTDMREAFAADPERFEKFSAHRRRPAARLVEMRGDAKTMELLETGGGRRRRGPPRRDVLRREDQHHRGPRRAAHGAAQPRAARASCVDGQDVMPRSPSPCSTPWAPSPTPCAPARQPAPPARRSPTSSTSASAAPISARPWRRWRWRPITTARARISSPTSTAPISPTR